MCASQALPRPHQRVGLRLGPERRSTPTGSVSVLAGETWNWQAWFRDVGGTSNFSDGVSIQFQ